MAQKDLNGQISQLNKALQSATDGQETAKVRFIARDIELC